MSTWLLLNIVVYGNNGFMGVKNHREVLRFTVEELPNRCNLRDCILWELLNIATPKDPLAHNVPVDFFCISANLLRASSFLTKLFLVVL